MRPASPGCSLSSRKMRPSRRWRRILVLAAIVARTATVAAGDYAYLDEPCNPYYVHREFPKLTTPQWTGLTDCDAAIVLAIDDMRDPDRYEQFLRPILDRLKRIDGRAPLSIMTNQVDAAHPQLARWLAEGVSVECHTVDHPCPLLQRGDFQKAQSTYQRCVDQMHAIPGNRPVAFRMPCCDSINSPSPRFFAEIFNRSTAAGHFLQIDSSVFHLLTREDPDLDPAWVTDHDGRPRFAKYLPFPSFVNIVENYPYPYVIGGLCWQFPCAVPSDWEAQHLHQPNNPQTVEDWKISVDATVAKQGVFNLVFHPHGWIRAEQVVELIDYAVGRYGKRVQFLSFRDAAERIHDHLLAGQPLRARDGTDNGVRLLDLNQDGWLDVVIGNAQRRLTRVWRPEERRWQDGDFPCPIVGGDGGRATDADTVHFGRIPRPDGSAPFAMRLGHNPAAYVWDGARWQPDPRLLAGWEQYVAVDDIRFHLRDLDRDGASELIIDNVGDWHVFQFAADAGRWNHLAWPSPPRARLPVPYRPHGDSGLRLTDVNRDGHDDLVVSNEQGYTLALWSGIERGWSEIVCSAPRDQQRGIPLIAQNGMNLGAWFSRQHMWLQNEQTDQLPDGVDRISFDQLLALRTGQHSAREQKSAAQPDRAVTAREPQTEGRAPSATCVLVGAAKIDITPDFAVRLHGYAARGTETSTVAQRLWAKALAIGSDEGFGPALLITVDTLGIPIQLRNKVARRLAESNGLRPERVAICATHTHTAPMLRGVAPAIFGQPIPPDQLARIERYTDWLADQLVAVAQQALGNRRPGQLAWTTGQVSFAANRRTPGGPVDHRLPVLRVVDQDQHLVALLLAYACHCTTLGPEDNVMHGDWAGCAQQIVQQRHPETIAMVAIGCGADANPQPRTGLALAEQHGRAIADEVDRLLKSEWSSLPGSIQCQHDYIDLPFDALPSRQEWGALAREQGAVGYHARLQLERLDRGESLPTKLSYPIATWTFGDRLAMVFLAGEVVVDYALRLGHEFDQTRLWINAYANDIPCYIPSRRVWREGGYEAGGAMIYYDQPTRLAEHVEDLIVDTVQRLVPHEFYSQDKLKDFPGPQSPDRSRDSIRLPQRLRIELVAAEPLVIDPVAFDWGPDGRLWVVQMHDYPSGLDGHGQPGGSVVVLSDTSGDGCYDVSQTFVDQLPYPTGVKVWRDGILVTAAPHVLLFRDTDGDGRADERRVLYEGFGEGNQQHRVNGLRWGLDNWLYLGNGDSGGTVRASGSQVKVNVSGRDLRIRPDTLELEAQSGQTQFGRCRDDWGNWFGGNNSDPLWHYVLDDHYLKRNPHLAAPSVRKQVPRHPGAAPVFPISRTLARFNDWQMANRITSACSPIIYRDRWLGDEFYGNSFVCEPVHNLIHREVVEPEGVSFVSDRTDDQRQSEFLASTDNWFRPVMIRTGPDGALWIADMYRCVIEHPQWIPEDWQRKINVRAGDQMGRIYRIICDGAPSPPLAPLDGLTCAELVERLASPNGWQRDMVQQMLLWRADRSVVGLLEQMVRSHASPLARLHALCTLDGLVAKQIDPALLCAALSDPHPGVRRHAVRISEPLLDEFPEVRRAVLELANDPDAQVQMQLSCSLGESRSPECAVALATLTLRHADDPYLSAAVASSYHADNIQTVLRHVFRSGFDQLSVPLVERLVRTALPLGGRDVLMVELASQHAKGADRAVRGSPDSRAVRGSPDSRAVRGSPDPAHPEELASQHAKGADLFTDWQLVAIAAVLSDGEQPDALDAQRGNASSWPVCVSAAIEFARRTAADSEADLGLREASVRLLARARDHVPDVDTSLVALLQTRVPLPLQREAVNALAAALENQGLSSQLIGAWQNGSPSIRSQIIDILLAHPLAAEQLLDAIEHHVVQPGHLTPYERRRLLEHPSPRVRERSQKLIGAIATDRAAVVRQYEKVLELIPNAEHGRQVFAKHCAACHRLDQTGFATGADLAALTDKDPQSLLTAVLDPNRAVEDKFLEYVAITSDGRQASGMILEETSTSIVLVAGDDKRVTLLRTEIDQLQPTGRSLMPEGFEKDLSPQDLADLIAYIRTHRAVPKEFPGNQPVLVQADDSGTLELPATAASIYGPRLVFEHQYQNLGWWVTERDTALWDLVVPADGAYDVVLHYACSKEAAGRSVRVTVAQQSLHAAVPSTDTWDNYQRWRIGAVELRAGRTELVVRSHEPINGPLLDLRAVVLRPVQATTKQEIRNSSTTARQE